MAKKTDATETVAKKVSKNGMSLLYVSDKFDEDGNLLSSSIRSAGQISCLWSMDSSAYVPSLISSRDYSESQNMANRPPSHWLDWTKKVHILTSRTKLSGTIMRQLSIT